MSNKIRVFLVTALWLCLAAVALAQETGVDEIIRKANDASYYAGRDGRADVKMSITDEKGSTRVREFSILRLNGKGKDQKFYVYFKAPADVR
ncbi:MAG: outer membrane lipoprotein-sorting protein, partial [Thermodesulfobacteriota bacterium]|nr:outer membrane lipoprotein-sorting protein [Thermodesulfobacteriota bacterium]